MSQSVLLWGHPSCLFGVAQIVVLRFSSVPLVILIGSTPSARGFLLSQCGDSFTLDSKSFLKTCIILTMYYPERFHMWWWAFSGLQKK